MILAFGALIVGFLPTLALAMNPERKLYQYDHTSWRRKDGAPTIVRAFAQTPDGFLWIGSADGLYRFDGTEFEKITTLGGTPVPDGGISALAVDDRGRLLFGNARAGGISIYEAGALRTLTPDHRIPAITDISVGPDGTIWLEAGDRLWSLRDNHAHQVGEAEGLPPGAITSMWLHKDGTLDVAVLDSKTVFRLAPGDRSFRKGRPANAGVLRTSRDGSLWISSLTGVFVASDPFGPREQVRRVTSIPGGKVLFDRDGGLWLHTESGVQHWGKPEHELLAKPGASSQKDILGESEGLTSNSILRIFEDKDGAIWLGTMRGIDRFREQRFTPVKTTAYKQYLGLAALEDGNVLLGPWSGAARILSPDGTERSVASLPKGIMALSRTQSGHIYAAGTKFWRSTDGKNFREQATPTTGGYISRLAVEPRGVPWIMHHPDRRVSRLRDGHWEEIADPEAVGSEQLSALHIDDQGDVWRAYGSQVIRSTAARPDAVTQRIKVETVGKIRVIGRYGQHVWVGGDEGLALVDGPRLLTIVDRNKQPIRQVIELLELSNGDLWVHQREGAVRLAADGISKALSANSPMVALERFGATEGLPGTRWTTSAAMTQGTDGRLWISTDEVVAWTDPYQQWPAARSAQPYIRSSSVDGVTQPKSSSGLAIQPGANQLQIDYGSISPTATEGIQFRYRLDGYEDTWHSAGSRRLALYTNVPPGTYKFAVSASRDDQWSEPASIAISVHPAWHQTSWFRALCIGVIAITAVIAYRLRIRRVTTRVQELVAAKQSERERIGQELHDSLLQTVYATILRVDLLARKLPADDPVRAGMTAEAAQLESVAKETRRRVAEAHASPPPSGNLSEELERYARLLLDAQGIQFEMHAADSEQALPPRVHEEVRAIAKEALMNASRHSMAQKVGLSLNSDDDHLLLMIEDDGVGMDEPTRSQGMAGHWGLPGIHERARRLGGKAEIDSRPGDGTRIRLRVPLPATA